MKVQLLVEVSDKEVEFFNKLIAGEYAWASDVGLQLSGPGDMGTNVDADWLLRASVWILKDD